MQNGWGKHDLGRPLGRSDGREKLGTWRASLLAVLAACLNCTYNVARVEVMDEISCGLIQLKSEGFFEKKHERG